MERLPAGDVGSTVAACIILLYRRLYGRCGGHWGDSLLEFLGRVQHFRKTEADLKYNPRVKLEYEAGISEKDKAESAERKAAGACQKLGG